MRQIHIAVEQQLSTKLCRCTADLLCSHAEGHASRFSVIGLLAQREQQWHASMWRRLIDLPAVQAKTLRPPSLLTDPPSEGICAVATATGSALANVCATTLSFAS